MLIFDEARLLPVSTFCPISAQQDFNFVCLLQVRFLSDLVNCHVIAAPSMVAMFENFISVTQEEDVPQVALTLMFPK